MEGNLFDYLEWRGDLTFAQSPLNPIDALAFSSLAYMNLPLLAGEKMTLDELYPLWLAQPKEEQFRGLDFSRPANCQLMDKVCHSIRFRNVEVTNYREKTSVESEIQFSAMTFLLPSGEAFLAFRGTDNTLVGWKEDFNMAFTDGTPAQLEAAAYAAEYARENPGQPLYFGGHSKGGNLAVWGAVHLSAEYRSRVRRVYSNDGPGFSNHLTESAAYREMESRILSYVPESSVVGVLMGCCDYITIKSSSVSVLQHAPLTWRIVGKHFVYETERTKSGKYVDRLFNGMMAKLDKDELSLFIEDVYKELRSGNSRTVTDLKKHLFRHLFKTIYKFRKFQAKTAENEEQKKKLRDSIDNL